jgi:hypothetical protein
LISWSGAFAPGLQPDVFPGDISRPAYRGRCTRIDLNGFAFSFVFIAAFTQIAASACRFLDEIEQPREFGAARTARALRWRIARGASVRRPTERIDFLV